MKILFINQFFWPDSSATSQLLTDLVRGLADRGHSVSVICADTGYAPASSEASPRAEVHRVKALPFGRGKVARVLSYASFYLKAFVLALTRPRPDLVVSMTTPPLISLVGWSVKIVRGSQHFIWEMDVYPDVAVDLDYIRRDGLAHRVTGFLARAARKAADGILVLGECMRDRLTDQGTDPKRVFITENWADSTAISPRDFVGDASQLTILYSGNLGLAHDLQTILQAMLLLRDDPRLRLLIAGGGSGREEVTAFCATHGDLPIQLLPYADRAMLGASLSVGDIGLVTQKDACCGSVVPSKVYGILAAGRPILFIGPRNATPSVTVAKYGCGWQVDCGDVGGLVTLLRYLAAHPAEVKESGARAREALLKNFDSPLGVNRIAHILEAA